MSTIESLGYSAPAIFRWDGRLALLVQRGADMFFLMFSLREVHGEARGLPAGLRRATDDVLPGEEIKDLDECQRLMPGDYWYTFAREVFERGAWLFSLPDLAVERADERRRRMFDGCGWFSVDEV